MILNLQNKAAEIEVNNGTSVYRYLILAWIWMPNADVSVIVEALTNNQYVTDGNGGYFFSCSVTSILSVMFGNLSINIPPSSYISGTVETFPNGSAATNLCSSRICGVDNMIPPWVFGTPFLMNVSLPDQS